MPALPAAPLPRGWLERGLHCQNWHSGHHTYATRAVPVRFVAEADAEGDHSAMTGLSRRRSRVRVLSPPSKCLQIGVLCCQVRRWIERLHTNARSAQSETARNWPDPLEDQRVQALLAVCDVDRRTWRSPTLNDRRSRRPSCDRTATGALVWSPSAARVQYYEPPPVDTAGV